MDARAGSLWHKTAGEAIPRNSPRHRGGPLLCLVVLVAAQVSDLSHHDGQVIVVSVGVTLT